MNLIKQEHDGNIFYKVGDFFGLFGGQKVSKERLLTEGYSCNPFMYNITNRVAEKIADLPYKFCDRDGNKIESNEIESFLDLLEQSDDNGVKGFIEKNCANMIALGEFFIYMKDKSVGFQGASGLQIVSPASIEPQSNSGSINARVDKFFMSDVYIEDSNGNNKLVSVVNRDEFIWGRLPNISPYTNRGLSPFEPNWDVVKATTNSFKAHGVLIKNMGANGLLVPESGEGAMPLMDREQNSLQKAIDRLLGGVKNFGKAIISNASMKWISIGIDPNKLEILKMQEQSLKVLCSAVNLDSKLFNDSSASTYNNLSEAEKTAYLDCYIPYAQTFFNIIAKALLPNGIYWKVDKEAIEVLNSRDFNFEKETREGILSIQSQVSSGATNYSAGLATLKYVYGIDDNTAIELLGEAMQIVNIEGTATIEEGEKSQARFSEFGVGGVQGILAIQTSVAQGITQYEAGISTLVLIYGLNEADARTILGDKNELENANQNEQL